MNAISFIGFIAMEWCSDWYRPDYYKDLKGNGTINNPKGSASSYDPAETSPAPKSAPVVRARFLIEVGLLFNRKIMQQPL